MIEDFFLMSILIVYLKKILVPLSYLMGVETNCLTHLPDTLLSCESGSSCSSGTLQVKYKLRPQDLFEDTTQPCIHVQRMGLVGDADKLEFEEFWQVVEN